MLSAPPAAPMTAGPVGVDRRFWWLVVALVALIPAVVVLAASVRYTTSDPHGALLVTEQLLTNGTITVDAYGPDVYATSWNFLELGGRHYYYFPLGSSLGAIPVVAVGLIAGIDLPEQEGFLQVVTAALLASTSVLLMYRLGRLFVGRRVALALSLVFWLATPLASTGGTAMWSQSFAVVFGLMSLIAVAAATERPGRWTWVLLGSSLFLAFLSRPTMAILAVGAMVYASCWRAVGLQSLALLTVLVSRSSASIGRRSGASCRPTTSHSDWPASIRWWASSATSSRRPGGSSCSSPLWRSSLSWPWSARAPGARGCDC